MEVFFHRKKVAARVKELANEIAAFYEGQDLTVIALMNGGAFFACDLVREMDTPMWFDSMRASSYIHDCRSGEVKLNGELKLPVAGRNILLVDDVFDSGETIRVCRKFLLDAGAVSVKCAVLVNKVVDGRSAEPDWHGFEAPDRYLVGFGLDSEEFYRNLPYVGCMD